LHRKIKICKGLNFFLFLPLPYGEKIPKTKSYIKKEAFLIDKLKCINGSFAELKQAVLAGIQRHSYV
jgi:hypothetical protein